MNISGWFSRFRRAKPGDDKSCGACERVRTRQEREIERINERIHTIILRRMDDDAISYEPARQRVCAQLRERMERRRLRMGRPIVCAVCGYAGCNRDTGPLVRAADAQEREWYLHERCRAAAGQGGEKRG